MANARPAYSVPCGDTMSKRKRTESTEPTTTTIQHGPAHPTSLIHGAAHLRAALSLTGSVSIDDVCEEAALMIERFRAE